MDKIELITNCNLTREEVRLKHHLSNPNSKSLRASTHAHLWKKLDGKRILVVPNPS